MVVDQKRRAVVIMHPCRGVRWFFRDDEFSVLRITRRVFGTMWASSPTMNIPFCVPPFHRIRRGGCLHPPAKYAGFRDDDLSVLRTNHPSTNVRVFGTMWASSPTMNYLFCVPPIHRIRRGGCLHPPAKYAGFRDDDLPVLRTAPFRPRMRGFLGRCGHRPLR